MDAGRKPSLGMACTTAHAGPAMTQCAISLAFDARNYLGEGPIWSPDERALWWINCENPPELHRWEPEDGAHRCWPMPSRIGGFVPKSEGGLLVVLADGLYDFDFTEGTPRLRVRAGLPAHLMLHECHCDRQGRLWVGTYDRRYPGDPAAAGGSFFRLDGDRLTPMFDGIAIANCLAFSPDGRTLYAASSPSRRIEAFTLDPADGAILGRRPFVTIGVDDPARIDGATVDEEGGYWLAAPGVGELRRYLPDGRLDRRIALPFSNPTKPAFGGDDMRTLFVTSTSIAINPQAAGNALNGGVFMLRPGVRGIPETPLRP